MIESGPEVAIDNSRHLPLKWIRMPQARASWFVDIRDLPPMDVIFGQTSAMAAAREDWSALRERLFRFFCRARAGRARISLRGLLHARSSRANHAFVKVTCPAIPHSLIESELFGYEKGAFTGAYATKRGRLELAHMGTCSWTKWAAWICRSRPSCCRCCRTAALCA